MKRKILHLLLVLTLSIAANISMAQVADYHQVKKTKPEIVLYSNTGISLLNYLQLHRFLKENKVGYPVIAMNLGAGYYSTFGKIRLGMDFGSTDASSENIQYITKHYGSFFSINLGCHIWEKNGFVIAPVIGYSSIRNNVLVEDKHYTVTSLFQTSSNSTSLTNNTNALKLQLSVEKILKSGLFAGLSFGYDYSFKGEQTWSLANEKNANALKDNTSAFYINLSIGTHLNYPK